NGIGGRMIMVNAGHAGAVKEPAWKLAQRITHTPVPQADVLIVGLAQSYSYGHSNNALIAAGGARVPPRYSPEAPMLREGGVV
ncbi:MAG TPA: hypothetical protein PKA20_14780, partial [Burkholderiaceae bacterium]|nr:hypothetical protein [Burkholderiaceae bacterium]